MSRFNITKHRVLGVMPGRPLTEEELAKLRAAEAAAEAKYQQEFAGQPGMMKEAKVTAPAAGLKVEQMG